MQYGCSPEMMDPRCNCKTGNCGCCGRRGSGAYPLYGDARYGGCKDIEPNCGCRFPGDGDPPDYLCQEFPQFEEIADGVMTGWFGSNCQTEQKNGDSQTCRADCQFHDPKPAYCEAVEQLRQLTFEELPDGIATGHLFPSCANGHGDPQTCLEPCNPRWLAELERSRGYLCPVKRPFEDAPDGYLLRVERCKGAPLYVTGWCRKAKSRRPGWNLCGGLHMYTKVCMRFNLCGGLRMSY